MTSSYESKLNGKHNYEDVVSGLMEEQSPEIRIVSDVRIFQFGCPDQHGGLSD